MHARLRVQSPGTNKDEFVPYYFVPVRGPNVGLLINTEYICGHSRLMTFV